MQTRCKKTRNTKQNFKKKAGLQKSTSQLLNIPEKTIEKMIKQAKKKKVDDESINIPEKIIKQGKKKKADDESTVKVTKNKKSDSVEKQPDAEESGSNREEVAEKRTVGRPPKKPVGRPPKKLVYEEENLSNKPPKMSVGRPKNSISSVEPSKELDRDKKREKSDTSDASKAKSGKKNIEGEKIASLKRKLDDSDSENKSTKKKKEIKMENTLSEVQISKFLRNDEKHDPDTKANQNKAKKRIKQKVGTKHGTDSPEAVLERNKPSKNTDKSKSNKKAKTIVSNTTSPVVTKSGRKTSNKAKYYLKSNHNDIPSTKLERKDSIKNRTLKQTNDEAKSVKNVAFKKTSSNVSASLGNMGDPVVVLEMQDAIKKIMLKASRTPLEAALDSKKTNVKTSLKDLTPNVSANEPIGDITQTIIEMQEKIKKLEKKSILDEKKIDMFRKALLKQRKSDIRTLMDETENELLLRMELLYLHYDPQRICRLCLMLIDKKECHTSLACNQQLISLVQDTTSIQVDLAEGMPSGICSNCLEQIEQLDWMKRRIKTSNKLVTKFLLTRKDLGEPRRELADSPVLVPDKVQIPDDISEDSAEVKIEDVFSLNGYDDDDASTSSEELGLRNTMIKNNAIIKQKAKAKAYSTSLVKKKLKRGHRCDKCRTVFLNRWSLNSHYNYCRKKIKCFECGKCFWHMHWYIRHRKQRVLCIRKKKDRSCKDCGVVFRWNWHRIIHILLHDPQICQVCDKTLYSEELLKQHVLKQHMDLLF